MTGVAADTETQVRAFRPADAGFAADLAAQVFARPWSAAQYADEATAADRDYLVAEQSGRPVGFAGAWDAPDVTHVMTVAVADHARRQGIARRLVSALLDRSTGRGATSWTLEVRADTPGAGRLYEQLGFVEVGRRPDYYGTGVDAVLMTRTTG